jgi:YhcH/YjgK/YiaL family protein
LEFLNRPGLSELADGRYEIDGDAVFALVQRYQTVTGGEPEFEAHRKYADVQFIAGGTEVIGWAPLARLSVTRPYDAQKDACFGGAAGWSPLRLEAGELAVFFPEDAHAPRLAAGGTAAVIKIVVKVAVQ